MLRLNEDVPTPFTIGIALDNRAMVSTVSRILVESRRYSVAIFDRDEVLEGHWAESGCDAVVTSPDAFERRFRRESSCATELPPVILALRKDAIARHRAQIAAADAFVVVDETLFLLPSLVMLSAHGLSVMPHATPGEELSVSPRVDRLRQLSRRDMQVLAELGQGKSNRAIASQLGMSLPMAKVHMRRIMERLGFRNRTDAAVFAVVTLAGASAPATTLDSPMAKGV